MKKNLITVITSTVISFLLIYFLSFLIVYFKNHEEFSSFLFKEMESLNFHKKYSKKMHHIRTIDFETPNNLENFLFSTINDFSSHNKNILLQGDSWMEAINLQYKNSKKKITKFAKENNYGLINAGITSFSPSLMMVQYATLENDFNIKPSIVVAYIDQTDIGDEICRYKDLRVLDKKNNLIAVKNEFYTRRIFDNGSFLEDRMNSYFEKMGIVKDRERSLKCDDPPISGRADFLLSHPLYEEVLLELKSINDKGFKNLKSQPKKEHMVQIQIYLQLADMDHGIVLYENKNDQHIKAFAVERDLKMWETIKKRCKKIQGMEVMPENCTGPPWCPCKNFKEEEEANDAEMDSYESVGESQ